MSKIITRLGDGSLEEITEAQLQEDLERGSEDAAKRARVPTLTDDEIKFLMELFTRRDRFVGVPMGDEIVLSYDGGTNKHRRHAQFEDRCTALNMAEKLMGSDTLELCHYDYSFKPVKAILADECGALEHALLTTHAPLFYGGMPNLGLYTQPDGPFPNPMMLLPEGKIKEARAAYEEMIQTASDDIVHIGTAMYEAGADALNLDTTGAHGDADVLAALTAVERLKKKCPDLAVMVGMAGEFIMGTHGQLEYKGQKLAGMYPHEQVKVVAESGAMIYGPVVNIVTNETVPWNVSRAATFIKPCGEVATIPVHVNGGMGVGGVTINDIPPVDTLSRATTALIQICQLDGL